MKTATEWSKYWIQSDSDFETFIANVQRDVIDSAKTGFSSQSLYSGYDIQRELDSLFHAAKPPHVHTFDEVIEDEGYASGVIANKIGCKCGATRTRGWTGDWVEP